jgi:hypothetical protein
LVELVLEQKQDFVAKKRHLERPKASLFELSFRFDEGQLRDSDTIAKVALHTDGVECTLSVGREVKAEIPAFFVGKAKLKWENSRDLPPARWAV